MNFGLIIAGGVGSRFGAEIPKQFVEINCKPIILYTLEAFQKAKDIDNIAVVCINGWDDYIRNLAHKFGISKLMTITAGGNTRFESIYNGILSLKDMAKESDYILIHDAVRACVSEDIIHDSVLVANRFGASLTVARCFDTMFVSDNGEEIDSIYPREKLFKGQTPETLRYDIALKAYAEAKDRGYLIDSPTSLLMKLGINVGLSKGNQGNIKITTQDDITFFRTFLNRRMEKK